MTRPSARRVPATAGPEGLAVDLALDLHPHPLEVSFTLPRGQVLAVLGPNGAGKSSLLGLVAGHRAPRRGTVTWQGRTLSSPARVVPAHRRGITLLSQRAHLFGHLSARENIAFGPLAQGMPRDRAHRLADAWLERVGLTGAGERRPHQLSGGQQQRVALARALAAEPAVVLLDEPFAALDAQAVPALRTLVLDELARTGTTAVLVTHDLADARRADDCLVLEQGRTVQRGPASSLGLAPATPFVARLGGWSVVPLSTLEAGARTDALAAVHPEQVNLLPAGAPGAGRSASSPVTVDGRVVALGVVAGRWQVEHSSGLVASLPWGSQPPVREGDRVALHVTGHHRLPG